ncbi:MAG: M1 family aminopeptidase [bacterium]
MKKTIIAVLLLCFAQVVFAQAPIDYNAENVIFEYRGTPNRLNEIKKFSKLALQSDVYPSTLVKRPYDVLSYKLFLDWTPILSGPEDMVDTREWNGSVEISLQLTEAKSKLDFDAGAMTINSILYNNNELTFTKTDNLLEVQLPSITFNKGDILNIKIDYTYIGNNIGNYIYPKNFVKDYGNNNISIIPEKIVYSQSEPDWARNWFPCNDQPDDKAFSSVAIKVPTGFTAASNGTLLKTENDDSSVTFYFSSQYKMASYLICANASKFYNYSVTYHGVERDIPLNYYVWEVDKDSNSTTGYNAQKALKDDTTLMKICESKFGPYPWESYGIVAVEPYMFGGMEHQTLTTVHRGWLKGWSIGGFMHELAHQWLGDLITTATWNDIWINEGGGSWAESFLWEYYYGTAGYDQNMQNFKREYIDRGHFTTPMYYIPKDEWVGDYYEIAYKKGAWVYNQLYQWYGGENFLSILRGMLDKYKYSTLETKDFAETLKEVNTPFPIPVDSLFSQYVIHAGHPIIKLSGEVRNQQNGNYIADMKLQQTQVGENICDVFWTPQRLIFKAGDQIDTVTFVNKSRTQDTSFVLSFKPERAYLDQNFVLMQSDTAELSYNYVEDESLLSASVYPNPIHANSKAYIQINIPSDAIGKIELFDLLGNKAMNLYDGILTDKMKIELSVNNLQAGIFYIRISMGDLQIIRKINIIN